MTPVIGSAVHVIRITPGGGETVYPGIVVALDGGPDWPLVVLTMGVFTKEKVRATVCLNLSAAPDERRPTASAQDLRGPVWCWRWPPLPGAEVKPPEPAAAPPPGGWHRRSSDPHAP